MFFPLVMIKGGANVSSAAIFRPNFSKSIDYFHSYWWDGRKRQPRCLAHPPATSRPASALKSWG